MPARLNKEKFVERAREKHGNKFNYDGVVYKNGSTKVKIYCNDCKEFFFQRAADHYRFGCPICANKKTSKRFSDDINSFLEKAKKAHGNRYGYDKVVYKNSTTKVDIYCKIHKEYFAQSPVNHTHGSGCNKCGFDEMARKRAHTKEQFVENARKVHGDKYCYNEVVYKNNNTKVKIFCNTHKIFFHQCPVDHNMGQGCKLCGWERRTAVHQYSTEDFIREAIKTHGVDLYDYSRVDYKDSETSVEIICKTSNKSFFQVPATHVRGCGSPYLTESKGEKRARLFLEDKNIKFEAQKMFKDLGLFRFDFYIPSCNTVVEVQGQQHYYPIEFFGGIKALLSQAKRDIIKKHYCKRHGIGFLEIPYWEIDSIESILSKHIHARKPLQK